MKMPLWSMLQVTDMVIEWLHYFVLLWNKTFLISGSVGIYGIIGDQITDTQNWKCQESINNQESWLQNSFNDSSWNDSVLVGGSEQAPWGVRPNIPSNADWIWTDSLSDSRVFCRLKFKPTCANESNQIITWNNVKLFDKCLWF